MWSMWSMWSRWSLWSRPTYNGPQVPSCHRIHSCAWLVEKDKRWFANLKIFLRTPQWGQLWMIIVYQWHCHIQLSLVATTVAAWLAVDVLLQITIFTLQMISTFIMMTLYFDDNNTQMQPESPGRPSIFPPQLQSPRKRYWSTLSSYSRCTHLCAVLIFPIANMIFLLLHNILIIFRDLRRHATHPAHQSQQFSSSQLELDSNWFK